MAKNNDLGLQALARLEATPNISQHKLYKAGYRI
jgi:hypothetical protein